VVALRAHLITVLVASAAASAAVSVREFEPSSRVDVDVRSARAEDRGPVAWIATPPRAAALRAPGALEALDALDALDAGGAAIASADLALASLSEHELDELRAGLQQLAARLDARSNPFGDDLDDGPPGEAIAVVRRSLAPALTAAHHLTARTQTSGDGTFAIVLGASCAEAPPDAACVPLWRSAGVQLGAREGDASAELRARASFFAWSIASAAVVRFADEARAVEVLEILRARARTAESRIAIALDERALAGEADPRSDAVREAARSVVAHSLAGGSTEIQALRSLAAAPAAGRRVTWLVLERGEIMVVPKLGGLSDLAALDREIDEVFRARGVEREARWIRRP
jgi:hypothetical protein